MADRIELTIREVEDQYADLPVRVTSIFGDEADAIRPEELLDLLHKHGVLEYHLQESRGITNWGATVEIQDIILTMAQPAAQEVIRELIRWFRSRSPRQTLQGAAQDAEAFLRQRFHPRGDLVCDDVRYVEGGVEMRLHDQSSVYEVTTSADGSLVQASRSPREHVRKDRK